MAGASNSSPISARDYGMRRASSARRVVGAKRRELFLQGTIRRFRWGAAVYGDEQKTSERAQQPVLN
ncbi:hypothetical protein ACHAXT_007769 [Thalassiosira profunda]